MNNLKTVGLLAFMTALLGLVVYWLGFGFGWMIAVIVGFNVLAYFFSDKLALKSSGARPVTEAELPQVYGIVRRLAMQMDMPEPSIHVIDSPQPNAFATGRSPRKAAVAVTTGILDVLDNGELEAVLGHELAHVQNRDILISSVAAMIGAALALVARFGFWFGGGGDRNPIGAIGAILSLILAPIIAMLIRFAISRTREFEADRTGAEITGQPLLLASALEKISAGTSRVPMRVNESTSQLFIDNPLKAARGRGGLTKWLSTHPPVEERVERLHNMAMGIS